MGVSEIKNAFYRYLLSVGKNDMQARRIAAYAENEAPVNFYKQVGLSKKQHSNVMNIGAIRSLTRQNKEIFNEVYRLYGGFIDKAASGPIGKKPVYSDPHDPFHDTYNEGRVYDGDLDGGVGYSREGQPGSPRGGFGGSVGPFGPGGGPGRANRRYGIAAHGPAAQTGESLKMAITKLALLFCMLCALCGNWLYMDDYGWFSYSFLGYTLPRLGREWRYLVPITTAPFVLLLIFLIVSIIMATIILFLSIRTTKRMIMGSMPSPRAANSFLSFIKYIPPLIHLAAGVIAFIMTIVFMSYFLREGFITGAPVFLLIVAIIMIVIVVVQIGSGALRGTGTPRRYYR